MNTQTALKRCFNYFLDHSPWYRDGTCVYYANGSNPVRCAIGCLIPPRYQKPAGKVIGGVDVLVDKSPALKRHVRDVDMNTLEEMQLAHDNWARTEGSRSLGVDSTREDFLDNLQHLMCFHEG